MDYLAFINNELRTDTYVDKAIEHRRHLHMYPELSFQEYETSAYIQRELEKLAIPFTVVANTGVVGYVDGTNDSSECIVLRADIDALPIVEMNDISYKSQRNGVMHACGHDFHTSNLLVVAEILTKIRTSFSGRIILLFQPAEEKIPGGAIEILKSDILEKYADGRKIKAVLGAHVSPKLEVGKIGVKSGEFMASSDEFYIKIIGKGGHAAEPHLAIDPIMIAAELLTTLQQVISRRANPATPSVLTFGRFEGLGLANVIPNEVNLAGTLRTMDEPWRKNALELITTIINDLPKSFGAAVELEVRKGYPMLFNNPNLKEQLFNSWSSAFGSDNVVEVPIWMAAEDFAYYTQRYPSLFFLIGINNHQDSTSYSLHNPSFDLDESAFNLSIASFISATMDLLKP